MRRLVPVLLGLIFVGTAAAVVVPTTVLPRPTFQSAATSAGTNTVHFTIVSSTPFDPAQLVHSPKPKGVRIDGEDGNTQHYVFGPGYAFDFRNYAQPPRIAPGQKEFAYEQVVYANQSQAGTLFVETAHQTYARSTYGLNGYLNAVGPRQLKLLWRSPAQVANAMNFVLLNETVVTGYGFTDEPDYLYALDRTTGKVKGRLLLPSAPQVIARHGNELTVTTYDHRVVVRVTGA
jgi:hypothetical protein